jgi:uncharacterized caspase-like protein
MSEWTRRRALRAALGAGLSSMGATLVPWRAFAAEQKVSALLRAPKHALVIGNSAYKASPLKNPANDARAMAAALKDIGFQVVLALDLPRADMLDAARDYTRALEGGKPVGLFYYAGHGMQLAWRNYLLPVDAALKGPEDVQRTCLDVNTVIEGISRAANPMNLIILDACRENPFARDFRVEQKGLSQLDAPVGTLLAYATSPGNVASDGAGANGLYTENLLREMRVPEAKIEDVFKRVRLAVRRSSSGAQVPWESTSLEDDFWFIPPIALKKLSDQEAARELKEELARQERLKAEREAEAERARREGQERLRAQREAEAERARRDELALRERLKAPQKAPDPELVFKEEAAFWERAAASNTPAAIEEYLWRYPSGNFTELAQVSLDELLAALGEKKAEVVASPGNPYSKGFARADTNYKVGDFYTYNLADAISKVVQETSTTTVKRVTAGQVFYDTGLVTDRLGNLIRGRGNRNVTNNQQFPAEFQLGRQWTTRYKGENRNIGVFTIELNLRIAARETITIAAGTFDTFRIDGNGVRFGGNFAQPIRVKTWFAPDRVRRFVLREEIRTGGRGQYALAERTELTAFRQA